MQVDLTKGSLYHTITNIEKKIEGNFENGVNEITGYHKGGDIKVGDELKFNVREIYPITEVIEIRDHQGEFKNPSDSIIGYFKVRYSYSKLIDNKNK